MQELEACDAIGKMGEENVRETVTCGQEIKKHHSHRNSQ